MDVSLITSAYKRIKIFLVFFCITMFWQCKEEKHPLNYRVVYEDGRAVALDFSSELLQDSLNVYLLGSKTPILGEFTTNKDTLSFEPLIPFGASDTFVIHYLDQDAQFTTRHSTAVAPELLHIYPSCDTVPENLLKFYFVFSKPMQEASSILEYITVKNLQTDTEKAIFLKLESQLWNAKHTQLTLWIDPGRVKTDLIPNQEKGLPLREGNNYELILDKNYNDAQGNALGKVYRKRFYVGARDSEKPNIESWELELPKAGTQGQLVIQFQESLDAILLQETLVIRDANDGQVEGIFVLGKQERSLIFTPTTNWKKGNYMLQVDARLEDLAANNLNVLFDHDIQQSKAALLKKQLFYKNFKIE